MPSGLLAMLAFGAEAAGPGAATGGELTNPAGLKGLPEAPVVSCWAKLPPGALFCAQEPPGTLQS